MKIERAIEILDPEHRERYESIEPVNEACRMGIEALKRQRWIPVTERLPELWRNDETAELVNYMIYSPDFGVDIGNYHAKAKKWLCMALPCTVTHWMPLPEAPREEAKIEDCPLRTEQAKNLHETVGYVIGRPIGGCALNGNEYVLDANGDEIVFGTKLDAVEFLKACGLSEDDIEKQGITFEEVEK